MEFSLDLPFIRDILTRERELALDEIRTLGVVRALEHSQQRHDARIASAPDVGTLACGAGCSWCCYFTVDARPVEVFRILDFVEQSFTAGAEGAASTRRCARTAPCSRRWMKMSASRATSKCPFLSDGRCSIYAARPQSCRNYHATNVAGCQQSYEEPGNLDIDPDFAPYVYQAGGAHVEAFSNAMSEAGYDVNAYELNCALDAALSGACGARAFRSAAAAVHPPRGRGGAGGVRRSRLGAV